MNAQLPGVTKPYRPPLLYPDLAATAISWYGRAIPLGYIPAILTIACIAFMQYPQHGSLSYEAGYMPILLLTLGFATAPFAWKICTPLDDSGTEVLSILTLCCFFPVWFIPASALGLCILAPFSCTAAWGLILKLVLGNRRALHFILMQTPTSLATFYLAPNLLPFGVFDTLFTPTILAWHLTHPISLATAATLARLDKEHMRDRCMHCGYSRHGIEYDQVCPECGRL